MPIEIKYPKAYSETEIVASLWQKLKTLDIDARLEVPVSGKGAPPCRLDLVIFKIDAPVCIIECKSYISDFVSSQEKRRLASQLKKYKELFDLPILTCCHFGQIPKVVAEIKQLHDKAPGFE